MTGNNNESVVSTMVSNVGSTFRDYFSVTDIDISNLASDVFFMFGVPFNVGSCEYALCMYVEK
jgi:hypothetical protein